MRSEAKSARLDSARQAEALRLLGEGGEKEQGPPRLAEGETGLLEKNTFLFLFIALAVMLLLLPFVTTFNDLLTRVVMRFEWYRYFQDIIVPYIVKMIAALLSLFGFKTAALSGLVAIEKGGKPFLVEIAWNCIGWQSFILFLATLFVGLSGKFTWISRIKAILIGFSGTFLLNFLRISLVVLLAYFFGQFPAIIFHDYFSTFLIIIWLFVFWWFSYAYVLQRKTS
jgi:exosortase/archaeosortase family protein